MEIKTTAYPKVNIHLAVGKKNYNGFHDISSIFQLVEDPVFHDDITVTIENSDVTDIEVIGLEGVADSRDNTVYKACNLFCTAADFTAKIKVRIDKHIPSQAGLGGGSSDAGAVLRVLNSIIPIGMDRIIILAALVGSDVPFFACGCKAAIVQGRGERVYPIEPRDFSIKLYPNENEKMSTAEAYKKLDGRKHIRPLQSIEELREMYYGPIEKWTFYNDFEAVNKPASDIHMKLTGSGTCRFTID